MSLLRPVALRALPNPLLRSPPCSKKLCSTSRWRILIADIPVLPHRTYAAKSKQTSTESLVPGSKQRITDETAREEYNKAEGKMQAAVEWYRKDCAAAETRASGRITPALLSPVRVMLPTSHNALRLEELATVGVREGSTLLVTMFDEGNFKYIERALYDSKIPGVVPQRQDSRTIRIPIPKPTVEARTALYTAAQRKAEDTRVQIRKLHQASLKRGKFDKHSIELEQFQKLTDRYVGEVEKILAQLKKTTAVR